MTQRRLNKGMSPRVYAVPSDISAALDELGIDHLVRGDEALGLCPSPDHNDRKPSWSCNLRTGMHNCFSCGFGGSFTKLVAVVKGQKMDMADLWVRTHRVNHVLPEDQITKVEERRAVEVRESDLWATTEPPQSELDKRMVSREAAQNMEILWDGKGWLFPIRNPDTGRLIGWQLKRDKYVRNRPEGMTRPTALFGWKQVRRMSDPGPIIVVESPLNAGRFATVGFPLVVATFGIEFTDAQMQIILSTGREILFAQDNDRAGQKKIAQWLSENPLARQRAHVFDYGSAFEDLHSHAYVHPAGDGRDPGDMTDRQIRRGVEFATPARRTRFEEFPQWR